MMAVGLMIAGVPGAGLLGFIALIIALSQFGALLIIIWVVRLGGFLARAINSPHRICRQKQRRASGGAA